jgi:hypothetical protein
LTFFLHNRIIIHNGVCKQEFSSEVRATTD